MKQIPIYKAEASVDGLAEQIQANASITYASEIKPMKDLDLNKAVASLPESFFKAHSGVKDTDLYPTKSILVTSNWNLNDDVFDKYETFAARNTPAHKPTNIGHDEHQMVGHMTDSWVVDADGNTIADNTAIEDVPDLFHIVNSAVIYTTWQDPVLVERTQKLIAEIEAGEKFVSMECIFSNFGYALISPDGNYYTLARNEQSAFLTKHLRVYGGTGTYEGHRVGRVPRDIIFSAKGYVDKPANKNSIIFSSAKTFSFSEAKQENPFLNDSGVSILTEDTHNSMANASENKDMTTEIYKEAAEKAEAKVANLEKAIEELRTQTTKAGVDKLEATIAELTEALAFQTEKASTELTRANELVLAQNAQEEKVAELTKANEELAAQVEETKAAITTAARVAELVEAGASVEDAAAKVEKFTALSDEQWAVIAETLVAAFNFDKKDDDKKDDKKKDDKKKDDAKADEEEANEEEDSAEANADEESLEEAKADEEAALSAKADESGADDVMVQTRKELRNAIAQRLGQDVEADDEE